MYSVLTELWGFFVFLFVFLLTGVSLVEKFQEESVGAKWRVDLRHAWTCVAQVSLWF